MIEVGWNVVTLCFRVIRMFCTSFLQSIPLQHVFCKYAGCHVHFHCIESSMFVVVGDFQVPCSHRFQQLHDIWSYCGTEQCYMKAVCNLVVEFMHNTVIQHVTVLFTITDYSFSVLRMNQHMTCETLENHWNQFSCSWLRFKFFVIEQDVCFHYAVPYCLTCNIVFSDHCAVQKK